MLKRFMILAALSLTTLPACTSSEPKYHRLSMILLDTARSRDIPVEMYFPEIRSRDEGVPHPVAFISGGYGIDHKAYSFLADALNGMGYLVVSVQHDLPSDEPLAREGDLYALRMPHWRRGEENLQFVRAELAMKYESFEWDRLVLIGHSNGGDISALFAGDNPSLVSALITLDHRRMPLPRTTSIKVLSIRASDTEADPGVLPNPDEQREFGIDIVKIEGARHNDMQDDGSAELKRDILERLRGFMASTRPPAATSQ